MFSTDGSDLALAWGFRQDRDDPGVFAIVQDQDIAFDFERDVSRFFGFEHDLATTQFPCPLFRNLAVRTAVADVDLGLVGTVGQNSTLHSICTPSMLPEPYQVPTTGAGAGPNRSGCGFD
jgi:hypothetical protein